MSRPLNPKQLKFVERYLLTGNATQSYLDAGYDTTRVAAEVSAIRLLKDARVQQLLVPARQTVESARAEQVGSIQAARQAADIVITRERIRTELARLAFVNPKAFFHTDGTARGVHELDDDTAAALAGFEVEEERRTAPDGKTTVVTRTRKFRLWDKVKSLVALGDTEAGFWANDKDAAGSTGNVNVNVTTVNVNALPAAAAVAGFLRDMGLPCPGDVPADGVGEPVDRGAGL